MSDTTEMVQSTDAGTLARTIAVAGLQVSQAADELQQAAERLVGADELQLAAERLLGAEALARDIELRARTAEEQVAQSATKNAELLEMLGATRLRQTEADDRARKAEERANAAIERVRRLEEELAAAEDRFVSIQTHTTPAPSPSIERDGKDLVEALAAEARRPLTAILGTTLSLKHADPTTSESQDMVRHLSINARKLDRLIGELLVVDRIADGTYEPKLRPTDLEAMVRRVVEESTELEGRDVHLQIEHVALEVDPVLAEQIVESLLANAGRRSAPGNPVWVRLGPEAGGAVIGVEDTCMDVPPALREAMLARGKDDHAERRGEPLRGPSGLPLPTRLAQLHGGRSWAEERQGGGASFAVFLPGVTEPPAPEV